MPLTFAPAGPGYRGPAVLLVAGTVGKTRLIDNMPLTLPGDPAAGGPAVGGPAVGGAK